MVTLQPIQYYQDRHEAFHYTDNKPTPLKVGSQIMVMDFALGYEGELKEVLLDNSGNLFYRGEYPGMTDKRVCYTCSTSSRLSYT